MQSRRIPDFVIVCVDLSLSDMMARVYRSVRPASNRSCMFLSTYKIMFIHLLHCIFSYICLDLLTTQKIAMVCFLSYTVFSLFAW